MSRVDHTARRWVGRGGTVAFVLAALAVARAIGDDLPQTAERYAEPHLVEVSMGQEADLRLAHVSVDNPRLAASVRGTIDLYETSGVWVIVDVTFTPTVEDAGIGYAELVDTEGRSYRTSRFESNSCRVSQPLITQRCAVALELPVEAVTGAVLRLAADEFRTSYDSMLEVDLGLEAEDATGLSADDAPVVLRQPDLAGTG